MPCLFKFIINSMKMKIYKNKFEFFLTNNKEKRKNLRLIILFFCIFGHKTELYNLHSRKARGRFIPSLLSNRKRTCVAEAVHEFHLFLIQNLCKWQISHSLLLRRTSQSSFAQINHFNFSRGPLCEACDLQSPSVPSRMGQALGRFGGKLT